MFKTNQIFESLKKEILERINNEAEKLSDKIASLLEQQSIEVGGKLYESIRANVIKSASFYLVKCFSVSNYPQYKYEGLSPYLSGVDKISKRVKEKNRQKKYSVKKKTGIREVSHGEKNIAWVAAKALGKKGIRGLKFLDIAMSQAMSLIEKEFQKI